MPPPGRGLGAIPSERFPDDVYLSQVNDSHPLAGHVRNLSTRTFAPHYEIFNNYPMTRDVYNQQNLGSCVCNAVSSAYRYEAQRLGMEAYYGTNKGPFYPSRLFLYYVARLPKPASQSHYDWLQDLKTNNPNQLLTNDSGTEIGKVLRILKDLGVPDESSYRVNGGWGSMSYDEMLQVPKDQRDDDEDVWAVNGNTIWSGSSGAKPPAAPCWKTLYQILDVDWKLVGKDVDMWKTSIDAGHPVMFCIHLYKASFKLSWQGREIPNTNNRKPCDWIPDDPQSNEISEGGHALLAIGWDDNYTMNGTNYGQCFKIQNSWGKAIHWDGFFYIPTTWLDMDAPGESDKMIFDAYALSNCSLRNDYKEYA